MASSSTERKKRDEFRTFDRLDALVDDLVKYIVDLSEMSIQRRKRFTVALSIGTLQKLLSRKFGGDSYSKSVKWNQWYIYLTDGPKGMTSDGGLEYKGLYIPDRLVDLQIINDRIKLKCDDSVSALQAAQWYDDYIRDRLGASPKFDLIILEMGEDGHVASLFPRHPALEEKEKLVVAVANAPEEPRHRITFTLPLINAATNVVIVAVGKDKAAAVQHAIYDPDDSLLPARMVEPTEGNLVWFLDRPASKAETKLMKAIRSGSCCFKIS